MKLELISVTPKLAQQWLSTNTENNRRISKATVNRYAADMIHGKWLATGEAIKFDRQGRLIDGQHRLTAIVASKQTVQMHVIRDLDEATMLVIDTGKSRTAGDALQIHGYNGHSNDLAALARKIIGHTAGTSAVLGVKKIRIGNSPITNKEIVEYCAQNDLTDHVNFSHHIKAKAITGALNHGEYAFFHWLFSQKSPEDADKFLIKLAILEDVSADSPIRALLQKLTRSTFPLDGKMKIAAVVQAWNAWRTGQTLTAIHVGRLAHDAAIPQAV